MPLQNTFHVEHIDLMNSDFPPTYRGIPHWRNRCLMDIPGEAWMDIIDFHGNYKISNFGRVKSVDRMRLDKGFFKRVNEKILSQVVLDTGYVKVGLSLYSRPKPFTIHTLVARHFISNEMDLPVVNHIYGVKTDNRASVLEWSTTLDNVRHAKRTGLDKAVGATHYLTKFTAKDVIDIYLSNERNYALAAAYGVTIQCISQIKSGKNWGSVTKNIVHEG